jgi:hypothetical protein
MRILLLPVTDPAKRRAGFRGPADRSKDRRYWRDQIVQYLVKIARYPRPDTPRPPVLLEATDDAAILAQAEAIVEQIRAEGAEKVQIQVRRAANLVLVGHVGDRA